MLGLHCDEMKADRLIDGRAVCRAQVAFDSEIGALPMLRLLQ